MPVFSRMRADPRIAVDIDNLKLTISKPRLTADLIATPAELY